MHQIRNVFSRFFSTQSYKESVLEESYNKILDNKARVDYQLTIEQMHTYVPKMMARKIPEANVQQAFVLDSVIKFSKDFPHPRILCVGAFEDTAAASLKKLGYSVMEIDPALNYDLDTFINLSTTVKESFDIIFSTSVIEHVEDDELFIFEISSLLAPGGVCVLTCDYNNTYVIGDKLPQTDLRFYTKNDLVNRLLPQANNCSLVGLPQWDNVYPDFVYNECLYTFATLTFRKNEK